MSLDLAFKLHQLGTPRLLVVGDLIRDVDQHGSCTRYAAEAGGCPVQTVERTQERWGGAGAVVAMARALGAQVIQHTGRISTKTRHFVDGVLRWRSDVDATPMGAGQAGNLVLDIQDALPHVDAVLVADYGKGTCTEEVLKAAHDGSAGHAIPIIVDPHRNRDWSRYGYATIKCNAAEWAAVGNSRWRLIVTEGARGLRLCHVEQGTFPARRRRVVDTTGAGDMVLAALGLCVAGGLSWYEACAIANAAAGVKVERHGAAPVTRAEVIADLVAGVTIPPAGTLPSVIANPVASVKFLPAELLPAVIAGHRAKGEKIAFTNGCFDLLHAGHVQSLAEARAQADCLVVAVNSDSSVARLKGPYRPLQPLADRLAVLAGLAAVDYVVAFDADHPGELIAAILPHVLVKGADYAGRPIAGADLVEAHGGRVHLAALRPDCSTTRLALATVQTSAPPADPADPAPSRAAR